MRIIKVDCSPVVSSWLANSKPDLAVDAVDGTLPISGFIEKIDLVIVGESCQAPLSLAKSISSWISAPLAIFLIEEHSFQETERHFRYAPGIGKNILCCPHDSDSFHETLQEALDIFNEREALGLNPANQDELINLNISPRWLLNRLLKELPEYIYFKDTAGRFLAVSNHLTRTTQLSTGAEAIGKTDFELFDSEHANDALVDEKALVDGHLSHIDKEEFVTWQDNKIWVQSYKLPLKSPSGYALGCFGISRDITQKKLMQDELLEQHHQLSEEMDLARSLQKSLLNKEIPSFQKDDGTASLQFCTKHVASTKLSGDYFRIFRTPSGKAALFIADVMGHGARAAMVTAMLYAALNEINHLADTPELYMLEINNRIHSWLQNTGQLIFASGIYCVLDTENGTARVCQNGGGHALLLQKEKGAQFLDEDQPVNSALGLTPQNEFIPFDFSFQAGDEIVFFTDGLIEATYPNGDTFGKERFAKALGKAGETRTANKIDSVIHEVETETKQKQFEDDICLVSAKHL